jgi:hypothetical protein
LPESIALQFALIDQVSAGAARIQQSLLNIEQALKKTQGTARAGTSSWAMFGIKMGAVAGIAAEATRSLVELGGQVLKMGATGAKWALEAGSFNENTQLSLTAILGSASAAQKAVSAWGALAERTPFDVRNVIEWGKQLTVAGESVENTVTVLKAVSDLGAKLGATPEKQREIAEQTVNLFARIKQLGSEASMRNLRGFADLGIPLGKMEQNLADRLTGGNIPQLKKLMETARTTGQDISHEIVLAALQAVQDTTGRLGGVGAKGATTLSSLLTRAQQRVEFDIFKGFEKTAGYRAIKDVLTNIIATLDPTSAGGKRIQGAIRDLSDTLSKFLGPLTGEEGKKNMEAFMLSFIDLLKQLVPLMERVASVTKAVFQFGAGKGDFKGVGNDVSGFWNAIVTRFGAHSMQTLPPVKTLGDLDATYGPPTNSGGVPPMLARPSVTMQTTVHVHGDASTDNLVEKINAAQEQGFYEWLEKTNLLAGAQ